VKGGMLTSIGNTHNKWTGVQSSPYLQLGVGICPEVLPTPLSPCKYLPATRVLTALEK